MECCYYVSERPPLATIGLKRDLFIGDVEFAVQALKHVHSAPPYARYKLANEIVQLLKEDVFDIMMLTGPIYNLRIEANRVLRIGLLPSYSFPALTIEMFFSERSNCLKFNLVYICMDGLLAPINLTSFRPKRVITGTYDETARDATLEVLKARNALPLLYETRGFHSDDETLA